MRAVRLHGQGVDTLVVEEVDTPRPASREALVEVRAAAITRNELEWPQDRLPAIPSYELAGVVDGEPVYALTPFDRDGVAAEFAAVPEELLVGKPRTLDDVQGAAVPLPALSAWQGLFDHGALAEGQRVLITGAAGGVGHFATHVQPLRHDGGLWGCDCAEHAGVHLFEDFSIVENVDADGLPVPVGEAGARLLVTNLFNHTQPLDPVRARRHGDGRPSAVQVRTRAAAAARARGSLGGRNPPRRCHRPPRAVRAAEQRSRRSGVPGRPGGRASADPAGAARRRQRSGHAAAGRAGRALARGRSRAPGDRHRGRRAPRPAAPAASSRSWWPIARREEERQTAPRTNQARALSVNGPLGEPSRARHASRSTARASSPSEAQ